MTRVLRLRREALSDLSAEELVGLAGAADQQYTGTAATCPAVCLSFLTFCPELCPHTFPNC